MRGHSNLGDNRLSGSIPPELGELTKLTEQPEMVRASLPKGLRVEPVAWCNRDGVFVGEAVMT